MLTIIHNYQCTFQRNGSDIVDKQQYSNIRVLSRIFEQTRWRGRRWAERMRGRESSFPGGRVSAAPNKNKEYLSTVQITISSGRPEAIISMFSQRQLYDVGQHFFRLAHELTLP